MGHVGSLLNLDPGKHNECSASQWYCLCKAPPNTKAMGMHFTHRNVRGDTTVWHETHKVYIGKPLNLNYLKEGDNKIFIDLSEKFLDGKFSSLHQMFLFCIPMGGDGAKNTHAGRHEPYSDCLGGEPHFSGVQFALYCVDTYDNTVWDPKNNYEFFWRDEATSFDNNYDFSVGTTVCNSYSRVSKCVIQTDYVMRYNCMECVNP